MGSNRISNQCLDNLDIPAESRTKFRRVVLQYIERENRYGGDLPSATQDDLSQICAEFLSSPELHKFQYSHDINSESSADDAERHGWLLQLVNNWIGEKKKQQSQEDPSYSEEAYHSAGSDSASNVRKKRKRPSDRISPSKTSTEKSNKKQQIVQSTRRESRSTAKSATLSPRLGRQIEITQLPRTPTIEYEESTQDMPYQNSAGSDSWDSLPAVHEILSPSSRRTDSHFTDPPKLDQVPSSARKGKMAVRDPPSTTQQSPAPRVVEQQIASPISPRDEPSPEQKQSRRITYAVQDSDDEDNATVVNNGPAPTPLLPSFGSTTIDNISQPPSALLTPPPTVRRAQFNDPATSFAPQDIPPTQTQRSFKARVQDVFDDIQMYIQTCETHSNRISRDASSSSRERQYHSIRAAAFAHLKVDICSRIDAFIERENGGSEDIPITEHCLHYP